MINLDELKTKSIGVLGFGHEGQALTRYFLSKSISLKIYDQLSKDQLNHEQIKLLSNKSVTYISTPEPIKQSLSDNQVVFKSPGVIISDEQRKLVEQNKVQLTSQTQWYFDYSPAFTIGVTGTKGKGTTCSLIYEMLKLAFPDKNVYLTGNIGKQAPLDFLDQLTKDDIVIYELSSFQLDYLSKSPNLAICLMVTEDHLDHHSDLASYHKAKANISLHQTQNDILIFNNDYQASRSIGEFGQANKYKVSSEKLLGLGAKINARNQFIELVTKTGVDKISTSNKTLLGDHNLQNIAAASLAAKLLTVTTPIIQTVVDSFTALPHRLETFLTAKGVKFVNDSISTNPDTTLAALRSFSEPVHLIVTGANKGLGYTQFVKELELTKNLKSITCIGEVGKIISDQLERNPQNFEVITPYQDFKTAVLNVVTIADPGDVVLFSPAATSFDLFKNYAERGDAFKSIINQFYENK